MARVTIRGSGLGDVRPNIDISHTINGRVKDFAEREGIDVDEAYRRVLETGLEQLDA